MLNFTVDDIGATIDGLVGRGVAFEKYDGLQVTTDERGVFAFRSEGPLMAWFKDPAGNIFALVQRNATPA